MAGGKNKAKTRTKAKAKAKAKSKAPKRSAPKSGAQKSSAKKGAAKKAARKGGARKAAGPGTEVEGRWREYWQCRVDLEEALAAVTEAESTLTAARELAGARREAFDRTKATLKKLLEVDGVPGEGADAQRLLGLPTPTHVPNPTKETVKEPDKDGDRRPRGDQPKRGPTPGPSGPGSGPGGL
ncbi:MAG: hypothetical protein AAF628_32955 [Planctomycetota bacterium]